MRSVARKGAWVLLAVWCVAARVTIGGQQNVPGLTIDKNSIGGTVVNTNGKPEAGVWVIAETKSLQTPFRKIVVTDRKSTRLNSSHIPLSRMPSSA